VSADLVHFNRLNRASGRQIPGARRDPAGMEIIKNETKMAFDEQSFSYRSAELWKAVNH
jgi:hypothetical protein